MESTTGSIIGQIAFYTAVVALLVLFFLKKRKQIRNTEKENMENQQKHINDQK